MRTWKTLATKKLLEHPRVQVYEDQVQLPSGKVTDYLHFGKSPDATCVIAINKEGKILVQKEYSYPPNEWLYQFPGGGLEIGETPEQGGRRELIEETNLSGTLNQIGWFYPDNRRRKEKLFVFTATNLMQESGVKDPEEIFEDYWYTISEVDELIAKGEIVTYSALAAWAIFKAQLPAPPQS